MSEVPPDGRATVLLVEDEGIVREVIFETLSEAGYRVIPVRNGFEALDTAQGLDNIDLLITDVAMPGLNGSDLADRLRTSRPDLKTLLISGYGLGGPGRDGQTPYLQKPFMPDELMAKIEQLLGG